MISETTKKENIKAFLDSRIVWMRTTKKQLSKKIGVSESAMCRHIADTDRISIEELRKLTELLGLSDEEVLKIVKKGKFDKNDVYR